MPAFKASTTNYTINVTNSVQEITVNPVAADPDATVQVNGTKVVSGGSFYYPVPVGASNILVTVNASDGTTAKTYVITVNRPAFTTNDNLSSLFTTGGQFTPNFSPSITSYSATSNYGQTSMQIVAGVADPAATIKINGVAAVSGQASAPVALAEGANTINVVVTAGDKITSKTYTINETRLPPSNNADLSSLWSYQGTPSPAFSAAITNYTMTVPYATSSVTVGDWAADQYAKLKVNGTAYTSGEAIPPFALAVGSFTINFVVTATDGKTTKTYTLTVTRLPASNDAGLSALTLSTDGLSPAFTTANTDYTVLEPSSVSSLVVTPTADFTGSTLTMNGVAATSGVGKSISLATGTNTITIVVTAQDGTTTKTYTIEANRLSPSANVADASLSFTNPVEKAND